VYNRSQQHAQCLPPALTSPSWASMPSMATQLRRLLSWSPPRRPSSPSSCTSLNRSVPSLLNLTSPHTRPDASHWALSCDYGSIYSSGSSRHPLRFGSALLDPGEVQCLLLGRTWARVCHCAWGVRIFHGHDVSHEVHGTGRARVGGYCMRYMRQEIAS
jgi:hypothetical protein